jgi:hypothetical protein
MAMPQPGGPPAPPTPTAPGAPPGFGAPPEGAFTDISAGMGAPGGVNVRRPSSFDLQTTANWFVGKPLLFLGLVLVLFGRGCDAIGMRSVGRTKAQFQEAVLDEKKKSEGKDKKEPSEQDLKRLKDLGDTADRAMLYHAMWSYWYVWVFVFGTLLLMTGLLLVAFFGQGPERWVAYIIIAIVSFSIYVGGFAWVESVVSSFSGQTIHVDKLGGFDGIPIKAKKEK